MKKIKSKRKRLKRYKFIQILFILPIIICALITSNKVSAGTQDSNLVRNQINGIYAVAPLSDRTHLYNLEIYKVNNKVSYCIEIGKPVTTNIYNSTTNEEEQEKITNLNKSKLNYIKLIAYFGYEYPGHNNQNYYMAAQELIWEYLNNIDVTWTTTLDINGPKIDIESYNNEIKNLITAYTTPLSFRSQINSKVGGRIVFVDKSNNLPFYEITSKGHQTISKSTDTLIIDISNNYIGQDKIILTRQNNYSYPTSIYYFDTSQALLSSGNVSDLTKVITLDIKGETLTTNLIDKDTKTNTPSGQASLKGAVYEIYDKNNNLVTNFTTDETGINTIENLYHDTYYIKQITPSKGYKLNEKVIKINLTSENNKLTLTEEVIKSTIEITKLYEIKDNYQRESNIQFLIYDNNNNLYTSITTTEYGPDNITLPYGIYTIKQLNTTYGYDKVKDINLNIDEFAETIIKYNLIDKKITSKIHITTKDTKTSDNIESSGITYKIKDKSNNEYLTYIDANNNKVDEFSTNKSGELTIPIKLPYGEYILEQTSTPAKYLENQEQITIVINDKSKYSYLNEEVVINVDFFNQPIEGKITIITNKETFITEDNNYKTKLEKRPNIEIELYYDNELLDTYKTNKEGYLEIENLKLGNYCVKEKNISNKECFELINTNNKTEIIEKNIELTEVLKTTNVILNNIDNNQSPIKGTTIELYKDDKLINTSITNEDGVIKITNLPIGNYCFKETKISSNYLLNEEKLCFQIKETSKNMNLTITNNLIINKFIKIPNTLSNNRSNITIILIISLIIGVVIYKKKKNNHNN